MKKGTEKSCSCEACQKYYSITHLALQWDMSPKTIRRMVNAGKMKAKRIGGSVRIPHSELLKVIDDI